jgi:hypothetical protein
MAIMAEPGKVEIAPNQGIIGTSCAENSEPGKPTEARGAKRLSLEEQRLFFRNSRNFFE